MITFIAGFLSVFMVLLMYMGHNWYYHRNEKIIIVPTHLWTEEGGEFVQPLTSNKVVRND